MLQRMIYFDNITIKTYANVYSHIQKRTAADFGIELQKLWHKDIGIFQTQELQVVLEHGPHTNLVQMQQVSLVLFFLQR